MPVVILRPAVAEDRLALWSWRNDPETRRASLDEREVPLEVHTRWLEDALRREDRRLYIVQAAGADAGMLRLDIEGSEATISINLAPEWRGRGVGPAALRAVTVEAFGRLGLRKLIAKVKAQNVASQAAFERAGFVVVQEGEFLTLENER